MVMILEAWLEWGLDQPIIRIYINGSINGQKRVQL